MVLTVDPLITIFGHCYFIKRPTRDACLYMGGYLAPPLILHIYLIFCVFGDIFIAVPLIGMSVFGWGVQKRGIPVESVRFCIDDLPM